MSSDGAAVNLEELKETIATVGNQIKTLKSADPVDQDAVGAAVKQLLELKQTYADNNNGIGVDGDPFGAGEKKKKEKGPAKQVRR